MAKQLNASKRFTKVAQQSEGAIVQFQTTINTLESSNAELLALHHEIGEEMDRLAAVQDDASRQLDVNTTTIQGLKNLIGE